MQQFNVTPPYKIVKGRHGWFLINPNDVYLGRAIAEYGEFSEMEWALLDQVLVKDRDCIEVGANVGLHSVSIAGKLAANGRRLLAVEPQPIVFQNLCANLSLNALQNVVTENVACSNSPGWLSFEPYDHLQPNNSGGVSLNENVGTGSRVRCVPLDELVPTDFDVGLIKIDVEGFEQKVLEGAANLLAKFRPTLYLENDRLDRSKALIEYLWRSNYKVWWHLVPLFNPDNFARNANNIYSNAGSMNMIAFPEELQVNLDGFIPVTDSTSHPLRPGFQVS